MKKQKKMSMGIKKSFWSRIPIIGVIRDIRTYRSWIKTIREEAYNPQSKFNQFHLNYNYFYVLYVPISLPEEDINLPENIKRLRLMELLTPIHIYLDEDLKFAGSIVPEFNQFYDDDNNPTLTYGIVYRFAFDTLSLRWVITRTIGISALIWALIKWPIISWVFDLIKGAL